MSGIRAIGRRLWALGVCACAVIAAITVWAGSAQADFGIAGFDQSIEGNAAGAPFTQAAGHPYAIRTKIMLNSHTDPEFHDEPIPDGSVKDVFTELPPGLLGNPAGIAQCTGSELSGVGGYVKSTECPIASVIGTVHVLTDFEHFTGWAMDVPLFNMAPPPGAPAQFGFVVLGVPIVMTGNVRSGGDFGVTIASKDILAALAIDGIEVTLWGVPADAGHDGERCDMFSVTPERFSCEGAPGTAFGPNKDPEPPRAFLTLPTVCTSPGVGMKSTLKVDSWEQQGIFDEKTLFNHLAPGFPEPEEAWGPQQALTGCDQIPFEPGLDVEVTSHEAASPTGLNIDLSVPQEALLNPEGIASADLKDTTLTLPAGMAVSPSAAHGLAGCSEAAMGVGNGEEAKCPPASKIGSVEIVTPLLEEPMHGAMYLAEQDKNPFKSLFALYMVVEAHGVRIKIPGKIELDPSTGQMTTTFENTPQLPFSELKVDLKAGPRAPLVTPEACGTYTTKAVLTPWSGNAAVTRESSFSITSGPGGSPCPAAPFKPGFTAGLVNNAAGSFSPFDLTFTRNDGEQQLGTISMHTPAGLLGMLSKVPLCGSAQAEAGTCGAESEIGTTTVGVGAGAEPYWVEGGRVYLTEAYGGGQFGLSIVVPAVAGPFNLGVVVVRAAIHVDPHTAELTIDANKLPSILDGIPLEIKTVNVNIDRPEFMFNPTSCEPMSITGTIGSTSGGSASVSSRFQAADCAALPFKPKLSAIVHKRHGRKQGAYLHVVMTSGSGQANIHEVHVKLPRNLPSRLTTLQQACTEEQFAADPAGCPAGSIVGHVTVHTPLLPVPLKGPAYFVSHGGASYPELVLVLQGYGVTIQLNGETSIRNGITSSTFKTVPDVPFSRFDLVLPTGPHSALSMTTNPCKHALRMPTRIVAQSGKVIEKSTKMKVTGCGRSAAHGGGRHGHHGKAHHSGRRQGSKGKGKH